MANETTPATKPLLKSKTAWVMAIAFAAGFLPAAQEWIQKNPVTVLQALAAVGVLLRFVTSGKVTIFSDDDASGSGSSTGVGAPGGKAGGSDPGTAAGFQDSRRTRGIPWLVSSACVLFLLLLPACTVGVDSAGGWSVRPDPKTIDAGLKYLIRHEEDEDGSKAGLTQWKYYDPATGREIPEEEYDAWGITP